LFGEFVEQSVDKSIELTRHFNEYKVDYKSGGMSVSFVLSKELMECLVEQFQDIDGWERLITGNYEWEAHRKLGEMSVDELKFGMGNISSKEAQDYRANLVAPLTVPENWN